MITAPINESHSAAKRSAALGSMLAAAVMTALKLAAGIFSGSLGVLSEAAHSGIDLAGTTLTFFSIQIADRPADANHPYGHGKFENLSAFGEVLLMAISCLWIILEAMNRIIHHTVELHHSIWPILVLLASIAVDYWRARRLRIVAILTHSPALAADAFHFASDIWSTIAVLLGLGASYIGARFQISTLKYADPLAAIVVSMMILRLTVLLSRETLSVLTDQIPAETRAAILREVSRLPEVIAIEQARVRRSGATYFADLTIALPRSFTFERTNALVEETRLAVQRVIPDADVVIHTIPRESRTESIFDRVRAVAARNNVSVHELSVQSYRVDSHQQLRVEQHLELNERMTLRTAHDFVTRLEEEILRNTPEVDSILTHIESEPATIESQLDTEAGFKRIEEALQHTAKEFPQIVDVHEILIGRTDEHVHLSCHCSLPDDLPMAQVHHIITALEDRLKLECPEVYRVMIHPEPQSDNLR